ncbi:TPA: WlaTC/HtrL family glycosyltransferase, partial [Citrobacter braakii]
MKSSTTIVTAYFDIGRGEWTVNKGFREKLSRSSDVYFDYFKRLAALENEMVIFTSSEFEDRVAEIRKGKPTKIITIDLGKKFKHINNKIRQIQQDDTFKNKLETRQ